MARSTICAERFGRGEEQAAVVGIVRVVVEQRRAAAAERAVDVELEAAHGECASA